MYKLLVVVTRHSIYGSECNVAVTSQVLEFDSISVAENAYNKLSRLAGYEVTLLY